jgi:hypothetical protein
MPVRKQGRHAKTTRDELNAWLGTESGKPLHVATGSTFLFSLGMNLSEASATDFSQKPTSGQRRSKFVP